MSHPRSTVNGMLFDTGCVACSSPHGLVCSRCEEVLVTASHQSVAGIDRCLSAYELDPRLRQMIAALKYRRQRSLASWFAPRLAPLVPRAADALTWLPATPERKRQRGFDQAQELAAALGQLSQVPHLHTLERDAGDRRQTGQSRSARLAGPQLQAIRACPSFVVLIDDVMTTGSSLRVAAQQLRTAGADRVVSITIAATPHRRDTHLHDLTDRCSVREWT